MKGALGMERFSLNRLSAEGLWEGSFTGDPGRYVKKGSGYGHLSQIGAPLCPRGTWNQEGARIPGTLNDE